MGHTRNPFQFDNYASSTAVSDDGCVGLRANVDGTALEVSYDGAAWATFTGGGGTPAGTGTELQYRNGAAFGAVAGSSVSGANITLTSDTVTALTLKSGADATPEINLESYGGTIASPSASGTGNSAGYLKFWVQNTTPTRKQIGAILCTMDGANAVNPGGLFAFQLRANGSAVMQTYLNLDTTVLAASVRGTFTTTATLAGINVGSHSANPSAPVNGDIWYNSGENSLVARIGGANTALGVTPRLDQVLDPTAAKTFNMSTAGTDYTLRYLWDSTTGATNLFTLEGASGSGATGAMLLIKPLGAQKAIVVNNGADVFTLDGGSIDMTGLLTVRDSVGLGIRIFDGATNNVYLQYVGATPALRVLFNGGPAISLVTETDTQTLTNKTLHTGTTVSASITWSDGIKQTFNPDGTNAGINVGSHAGDPGTPANGDLWYSTATNALRARINGATVSLGAGGGTIDGSGTANALTYWTDSDTVAAVSGSSVSGSSIALSEDGAGIGLTSRHFIGSSSGGGISIVKGRGTAASPTAVLASDLLGAFTLAGQYSSTIGQITIGAGMYGEAVSNYTAANAAETDLTLRTKRAGSSAVRIGLRVTSDQRVGVGDEITHADVTAQLTTVGDVKFTNTITSMANDATYYGLDGNVTLTPGGAASGVIIYGISTRIDTTNTTASYNDLIGMYSNVRLDQAVSGSVRGLQIEVITTGNATSSAVHGILMDCNVGTNRTITEWYGMQWSLNGGITGTVTTAYGARWDIIPVGTTVGTYYGLYLDVDDGSAKITNTYGIVVTSDAGNSGFGTIAPTAMLHTVAPLTTSVAGIFQTAASSTADCLRLMASSTVKVKFTTNASGDMNSVFGSAALSTTATDGFIFMPTCAGVAAGTPSTYTGTAPVVIDTTNFRIYVNIPGTGWKMAQLA